MKWWLGLLAGLVLIAGLSYGAQLKPEGHTLLVDYLFATKGVHVGNQSTLNSPGGAYSNNTFVEVTGLERTPTGETALVGIGMWPQYISNDQANTWLTSLELDTGFRTDQSNPPSGNIANISGYPSFNLGTGAITTLCWICAGWSNYTIEGAGTVTDFSILDLDYQGVAEQVDYPKITNFWGIHMRGTDQAGGNIRGIKNNLPGRTIIGTRTTSVTNAPEPSMVFEPVTFANLTAAPNGTIAYCGDCNATCAAGGGSGKFCKREGGAWAAF